MLPLIVLLVGLILAFIGRILLFIAAVKISPGWAVGVWLPFGPIFFRRAFPDEARRSQQFRIIGIPLILLYFVLQSGTGMNLGFLKHKEKRSASSTEQTNGYAMEKGDSEQEGTLEERRAANAKELDRLATWNEALKLKKRDLLHSDVDGNRAYEAEAALYNEAFSKATAEKDQLNPVAKSH